MRNGTIFVVICMVLLSLTFVQAHSDEDFAMAQDIINQKTPCSDLTSEQIEMIGDYYMEQMHPGEAHEYMDEMMGGEGSESLAQMHTNIAYRFYCSQFDDSYTYNASYYGGMMYGNNRGNGMMGNSYYHESNGFLGLGWLGAILIVLIIVVLVLVIILLVQRINKNGRRQK